MQQQQQGVPLSEVAARLGVSTDVVRKRVKRGTMPAFKAADGRWYAFLDGLDSQVGHNGTADLDAGRTVQVTVSSPPVSEDHTREATALRDFLASREQEIEFLRSEMAKQREHYAEESRRKDIIIHELTSQLKALPEAIVEVQAEHQQQVAEELTPSPKRPWWRFWEV
jgi:hypothetical protein